MKRQWHGVAAPAIGEIVIGIGSDRSAWAPATGGGSRVFRPAAITQTATDGFHKMAGLIGLEDETPVAPRTIDDGEELLPQATISLDQAIAAPQAAGRSALGEIDLEF